MCIDDTEHDLENDTTGAGIHWPLCGTGLYLFTLKVLSLSTSVL